VPVFSDLDARALGTFEGTNDEESWKIIHSNDEAMGIYYKAPQANDGTPRLLITLTHPSMHALVSCYCTLFVYYKAPQGIPLQRWHTHITFNIFCSYHVTFYFII
jgi:hypothetical protein